MEIKDKIQKASKWSLITELLSKLMMPITNMILARLLVPGDFGMVTTITMVTSFADIFTDAGFQKYIVQEDFEDDKALNQNTNVAFWTNFALSLIIWIAIVIFKDDLARIVGNDGLGDALAVSAITVLLSSFSSIQMARFRKDLEFGAIFVARVTGILIPLVVTVPLAFLMRSFWALIIGNIAVAWANAIFLTIKSKWKPGLYYNFGQLKSMLGFSIWALFEQILGWANLNIGIFIVGAFLSDYYLGLYKTSMTMVNQVFAIITSALSPVILSSLAKFKNEIDEYQKLYYRFTTYIGFVCIPIGIGIYLYRDFFVMLFLGRQWAEAAGFVGLWGLTRALQIVFSEFSASIFFTSDKPHYGVIGKILQLIVLVPALVYVGQLGYSKIYVTRCIVIYWAIFVHLVLVYLVRRISFFVIIKNIFPFVVASLFLVVVKCVESYLNCGTIGQILSILVCVMGYFSIVYLMPSGRKTIRDLVRMIGHR